MKANSTRFPFFLFALLLMVAINFSCRKIDIKLAGVSTGSVLPVDAVSQKFFETHLPTDPIVMGVKNKIFSEDQQKPFIEKFVKYAGYPVWDKSIISGFEETKPAAADAKIVLIPFAVNGDSSINAILKVGIGKGDTAFSMLYRWQYKRNGYKQNDKGNNAGRTALLFMGYESYVFGHHDFKIKDSLLFKDKGASSKISITSFNKTAYNQFNGFSITSICFSHLEPAYQKTMSVPMHEVTTCDYYSGGGGGDGLGGGGGAFGGGGTGGGGGGGSSNGNGGSWNDNPCVALATERIAPCESGNQGWEPIMPPRFQDPCDDAKTGADKATGFSKNSAYTTAKSKIQAAAADGKEHNITFGKDANGNITMSSMTTGNETSGNVNTNWLGAFADLHNHPNNVSPSAGDMYGLIAITNKHTGYDTRYVVTQDGTVYAFVINSLTAANAFMENYPQSQVQGYPPDFPETLADEYNNVYQISKNINGMNNIVSNEMAMAFILNKYNSGVVLLKQDRNGNFKKLGTAEAIQADGSKTYTANNCP